MGDCDLAGDVLLGALLARRGGSVNLDTSQRPESELTDTLATSFKLLHLSSAHSAAALQASQHQALGLPGNQLLSGSILALCDPSQSQIQRTLTMLGSNEATLVRKATFDQ